MHSSSTGASSKQVKGRPWLSALVFLLCGLFLVAAGGQLLGLGGSAYYLLAGLAYVATAVLAIRRSAGALWLQVVFVAATLTWGVSEAGLEVWGLLPRIFFPAGMALWFVLPGTAKSLHLGRERWLPAALFLVVAALLGGSYVAHRPEVAPKWAGAVRPDDLTSQWRAYGNDAHGGRFAPLGQINRDNVTSLRTAWQVRLQPSGILPAAAFEATPLQVDDQLILCTPTDEVVSVDADTGQTRWRFDPKIDTTVPLTLVCRGVAFHEGEGADADGSCARRVLVGTLDSRLLAIDAMTGRPCRSFGRSGAVDLTEGLGRVLPGYHTVTSPPAIVGNVAVVGSFVLDNQSTDEPSGVVRGYDVRDGRLLWAWDALSPLAHPSLKPGEVYPRSSPNMWSVASADPELGLVYLPTGGSPPDYYGGHRTAAEDRYGSSVVALDVKTGNVRWSFQTVHHDLWDNDVAAQPVLFDFPVGKGRTVPALVASTKRGELFILDRSTGKPLLPVEERPVPRSDVKNERPSPTQPFTTGFPTMLAPRPTEAGMWGITPFDQLMCRIAFRKLRYDGLFTPPSLKGTLVQTGQLGGFNWGSVTVDPDRQLLIGNFNWVPVLVQLLDRHEGPGNGLQPLGTGKGPQILFREGKMVSAQSGAPYAGSAGPMVSPFGVPCTRPPWGQIVAIDLKTRSVRWQRPLGTTRDLAPLGLPLPVGVPNMGGAITTRSGLTFIGAAVDDYLRAFDSATGEELWKGRLPAGGQATPMTYVSPRTGRQYVVIAAGGHPTMRTKQGDYLVAYALPTEKPTGKAQ